MTKPVEGAPHTVICPDCQQGVPCECPEAADSALQVHLRLFCTGRKRRILDRILGR